MIWMLLRVVNKGRRRMMILLSLPMRCGLALLMEDITRLWQRSLKILQMGRSRG